MPADGITRSQPVSGNAPSAMHSAPCSAFLGESPERVLLPRRRPLIPCSPHNQPDQDRRRQHPNPKRSQPKIHLSPPSELVPKWNKLPVNHCRTVEAALQKPLYSGTFDYPAAVSSLHSFSKNRRNRSACALPFCVGLLQHRLTDSTRLCHIPDLKWRVLYFF